MNIYAHKTDTALYAIAAAGKRNSCADRTQRLCKNFKPDLHAGRKKILPDGYNSRGTVDSIIRLFNGTVVTGNAPVVEWGGADYFL